jgi:hypothetical protein
MFVSKKVLTVCLFIGIIFIPFLGSGDLLAKKKKSSSIEIAHSPIKYFVPGSRIKVGAEVTDPTGIMLARCYFKAEGAADFVFVDMTSHSDEYDGILPSPSPNTNRIEYLILAVNNKKVVYKTQSFFMKKSDKKKPAWQNVDSSQQITVKTELPTPPETIAGFSDDIAVDVVESALRFGLVAGGIYAAAGLTAPAGATAGGTVAASGGAAGGISAGTIALGAVGAGAVVGGAVALTSGGDDEGDEGSDLPGGTGEVKVTLQWSNCADLDLHVTDPCGNHIYYSNRSATCDGKTGNLDVDANAGCGSLNCNSPAENIYWTTAPSGSYRVEVDYYRACSGSGSTSYTVTTIVDGRRRTYSGSISPNDTRTITTFTF